MRRRNAIAAVVSIILLIVLLGIMLSIAFSGILFGFDLVDRLVFGGITFLLWIGVVILAVPIFIFVIITIIWLVLEARAATKLVARAQAQAEPQWQAPKASPQTPDVEHEYTTGQISPQEYEQRRR